MSQLAVFLGALTRWRRAGAAIVAGALSVLALAPYFFPAILFVTFPVLIWLLDGCCGARPHARADPAPRPVLCAALTGWCFGFGYFLAGLYWVGAAFLVEADRFGWLLPFVVSLLPAGLALFFAAATAFAAWIWRPGPARLVGLAVALMVGEWLRGHILSGFPWNTVGYVLTSGDYLIQASSILGVYGLTPIAVLIFSSPAAFWASPAMASQTRPGRWGVPLSALVLLVGAFSWGAVRLANGQPGFEDGVRMRIVQPNIPQTEKWKPENRAQVFSTLLRLSAMGSGNPNNDLSGITHVIWPESSVPFLLADTNDALAALAKMLPPGTTLIAGAARGETDYGSQGEILDRRVYNSVFVMDHDARILDIYDKNRLVPFGEFLPLQDVLESIGLEQLTRLRGGFAVGTSHGLLRSHGAPPFSALICYEIIFPHWVRGDGGSPGWLLNVTNDAWFGDTSGPHQHFHQARVRAVEQGLPVVRAANSGISGVIDAYGRVVAELAINSQGTLDSPLPSAIAAPPFAKWGRAIEAVILVLLGLSWVVLAGARRRA